MSTRKVCLYKVSVHSVFRNASVHGTLVTASDNHVRWRWAENVLWIWGPFDGSLPVPLWGSRGPYSNLNGSCTVSHKILSECRYKPDKPGMCVTSKCGVHENIAKGLLLQWCKSQPLFPSPCYWVFIAISLFEWSLEWNRLNPNRQLGPNMLCQWNG